MSDIGRTGGIFVKYLVENGSPVPSPGPKVEPPSVEVKELESGGSTGTPDTPARTDHKPGHKKKNTETVLTLQN